MTDFKREEMRESTLLIYKTQSIYENVLKWLFLCALKRECISPPNAELMCSFSGNHFTDYAECHRYDQSILNILLCNYFKYSDLYYAASRTARIDRADQYDFKPNRCGVPY